MKTIKDNIKESINKLEIAQSRLEDKPRIDDVETAMKIIVEVLNSLNDVKNAMSE